MEVRITSPSTPSLDDRARELLATVSPRLRAALIGSLGPHLGEDAFAEAMLYAWGHQEKVLAVESPVAYLFKVGRSRVRPRRLTPLPNRERHNELPEVEPELHTALMGLTTRQRTAVVLVIGWGWSHAEVAELLGISKSSVQQHAARGLDRLQRQIGTDHER